MKPNLKKKIAEAKSGPDYMTRAKITFDSIVNPYQAQVDNTAIQQPLQSLQMNTTEENPEDKKKKEFDKLIHAQQWKETGGTFKPDLVSPKGAKGIAQIMPNTWQEAIKKGWVSKDSDILNPKHNEQAQRKIMEHLLQTETVNNDVDKALAAYNWGFGNLRKQINKYGDKWLNQEVPLETRDYIKKIKNYQDTEKKDSQ